MEAIVTGSEVESESMEALRKHSIYMQLDKYKSDTNHPLIYTLI